MNPRSIVATYTDKPQQSQELPSLALKSLAANADVRTEQLVCDIRDKMPLEWKRAICLRLIQTHLEAGLDLGIATTTAADLTQASNAQIDQWWQQFIGGSQLVGQEPSLASPLTLLSPPTSPPPLPPTIESNKMALTRCKQLPVSTQRNRDGSVRRPWLLEEYPMLLTRAQDWVCSRTTESIAKTGHLFKITEFQRWVNDDLLVALYRDFQTQPISHSTARTWLNRLGYYERQKQLQHDQLLQVRQAPLSPLQSQQSAQHLPPEIDYESAKRPPSHQLKKSRKRASTWSAGTQQQQVSRFYTLEQDSEDAECTGYAEMIRSVSGGSGGSGGSNVKASASFMRMPDEDDFEI